MWWKARSLLTLLTRLARENLGKRDLIVRVGRGGWVSLQGCGKEMADTWRDEVFPLFPFLCGWVGGVWVGGGEGRRGGREGGREGGERCVKHA